MFLQILGIIPRGDCACSKRTRLQGNVPGSLGLPVIKLLTLVSLSSLVFWGDTEPNEL